MLETPPIRFLFAFATLLSCVACDPPEPRDAKRSAPAPASKERVGSVQPVFRDRAPELGLSFIHFNGMSGELYYPELMGAGAAWIDYDLDGDLDVYLVQGHLLGQDKSYEDTILPFRGEPPPRDRLFRNQLEETGSLSFVDVTEQAELLATGYGTGVAVGDVDNDGYPDLFLSNLKTNELWRNRGNGTFEEVGSDSGIADHHWSSSSAFLDFDQDGDLDLFVANYVQFDYSTHKRCYASSGIEDYCGPSSFESQPDRLYRNRGDGTFEDVSVASGISAHYGAGLGVSVADFNGDTRPDIYVANDGTANQLWIQSPDGSFEDDSRLAGCALNMEGKAEGSMGVDAADIDGDGFDDLFMTHIDEETNTVFLNDGQGLFEDRTLRSGLAAASLGRTGFGLAWLDWDGDGLLDLAIANGAVLLIPDQLAAGDLHPLRQKNQLFRNLGGARFEEVSRQAGVAFGSATVSRGLAAGDADNDGDLDLLLANNGGPVELLMNETKGSDWLGFRVLHASGRDALGASVVIEIEKSPPIRRRIRSDGSYASAQDPRALFGLRSRSAPVALVVTWPDGRRHRLSWDGRSLNRYYEVRAVRGSSEIAVN